MLRSVRLLAKYRNMHPICDTFSKTDKFGSLWITTIPALSDNYMYIVTDEKTKESAVIDPVQHERVLKVLEVQNWNLTKVLTTHHHLDHAGGNKKLLGVRENLEVYGGDKRIEGITKLVKHDDIIRMGSFEVKCIATPCHTTGSICYLIQNECGTGVVFTGDTLFISGCGRFFEGTAQEMYTALVEKLGSLPKNTKVYCGHEYTCKNLEFCVHVEPDNEKAKEKLDWARKEIASGSPTVPSTIEEELRTNPFMRVHLPSVQQFAKEEDHVSVMAAVRRAKDNF